MPMRFTKLDLAPKYIKRYTAYSQRAIESEIKNVKKQECIPVGCVPSAAVAVCLGGGCLPGGVYPSMH